MLKRYKTETDWYMSLTLGLIVFYHLWTLGNYRVFESCDQDANTVRYQLPNKTQQQFTVQHSYQARMIILHLKHYTGFVQLFSNTIQGLLLQEFKTKSRSTIYQYTDYKRSQFFYQQKTFHLVPKCLRDNK